MPNNLCNLWFSWSGPVSYFHLDDLMRRVSDLFWAWYTLRLHELGFCVCYMCSTCYVIRKRWSTRFRCTAWKNRILGKFVKNALFIVCDVTIFLSIDFMCLDRYIPHNKYFFMVNDDLSWRTKKDNVRNIHWMPMEKGSGCGLSSAQKKQPTYLHINHDYLYIFQKNNSFFAPQCEEGTVLQM